MIHQLSIKRLPLIATVMSLVAFCLPAAAVPTAPASQIGSGVTTTPLTSFRAEFTFNDTNLKPDLGKIWQGYTRNAQTPLSGPNIFTPEQQGGMDNGPLSGFQVTETTNTINAQGMGNTAVPLRPVSQIFTVDGTTNIGYFGPPRAVPFHTWMLFDGAPQGSPGITSSMPFTQGSPPSDFFQAAYMMDSAYRLGENLTEPNFATEQAKGLAKTQQAQQSTGAAANQSFDATAATVTQSLINVANENAGSPLPKGSKTLKTLPQAIWMVQQLYKYVFMPMAILLLLPGAVITQTKSLVQGTIGQDNTAEDIASPFVGILRAMVAIFLIPATQMFISYSIDIGNSMTYEVQKYIDAPTISTWVSQQTNGTQAANQQQQQTQQENENGGTSMAGAIFNEANMFLNYALTVLVAYQIILMCYLLLMGPVAAAFYAWPASVGSLFRPIFSNWIDAVTVLALWRFWWCVILLCMSTRIHWLQEIGQYNPNDPWEKATFTAFVVMLTYVPFAPFDFRPGDLVDMLMQKAGIKK